MNRILSTIALALLIPALASAQHPQSREGFGIGLGLGAGSAAFCDGCDDLASTELSGYLRLGGYLNPAVFLAAESNGWIGGADSTRHRPSAPSWASYSGIRWLNGGCI